MTNSVKSTNILRYNEGRPSREDDLVAAEEPLEIRLKFFDGIDFREKRLVVTMRTPGNDFELALGFLFSEGIIASASDVGKIFYCTEIKDPAEEGNVVIVHLNKDLMIDDSIFNRNFYMNSSCGVCGKSSIESIEVLCHTNFSNFGEKVSADLIHRIPNIVSDVQHVFKFTGGLHASALMDLNAKVEMVREDIGRHNALDKIIGAGLAGNIDFGKKILFVSGRAGFELVQKAIVAGIPLMIAVGAPSSLAVELAVQYKQTLIGFNRKGKFNVYSGSERIS